MITEACRAQLNIDSLVNEMLNYIPEEVWKSSTTTFLDPSVGGGQFVKAIESTLRLYGHNGANIAGRVFGCEKTILHVNYAIGKHKVVGNYFVANSLKYDWKDMKFDVIVGNPPYQETKDDGNRKDQASNLWSKFWGWAIKNSNDTGKVALVTPTSWITPSQDLKGDDKIFGMSRLWDVFNTYSSYANVIDVAKHFPGVGSTFGYAIIDKSSNGGLTFSDNSDTSFGFLPKSNFTDVKKQLDLVSNLGYYFKVDQVNDCDWRVSIPLTRVLTSDSIEILNGVCYPSAGSEKDDLYLYVHIDSAATATKVRNRIISCLSILNTDCRWSGFMNIRIVKMISYTK
jgi:hypothetical protein